MSKMQKALLSALMAGVLATVVAFLTVLTALPEGAVLADIKDVTWAFLFGTGLVVAGKDFQAYLSESPTKPSA